MYFLLTAPHPDDDVIGLGDYVRHIDGDVGVWFMTDGGNPKRRVEATKALNMIGVRDIYWKTLPFYTRHDRHIDEEDILTCQSILSGIQPSILAVCYDADPHETHVKCYNILRQATQTLKGLETVLLYKSAWSNRTKYPSLPSPWKHWTVRDRDGKREALACHESQLSMKVHDGFGGDLLQRGNLDEEVYLEMSADAFHALDACSKNIS